MWPHPRSTVGGLTSAVTWHIMATETGDATLLATTDLDEVRQVLGPNVSLAQVDLDTSRQTGGEYRLSRVAGSSDFGGNRIGLMQWEVGPELRATTTSTLRYTVGIGFGGQNEVTVDRKLLSSPLCTVTSPYQQLESRHAATKRWLLSIGHQLVVEAVQARLEDASTQLVVFDPVLRSDDPLAAAWLRALHGYAEASRAGLLARSPLGAAHLERALVHGLLDIQPHTFTDAFAREEKRPGPLTLRRAIEFCEMNLARPIVAADIASAAHTTPRTLQRMFRAELGASPMEYLRELRLDGARRDLLRIRGGDAAETVTEVASRWGFVHLGRFSKYYGLRFGERPSSTAGFPKP